MCEEGVKGSYTTHKHTRSPSTRVQLHWAEYKQVSELADVQHLTSCQIIVILKRIQVENGE